MVWYCLVVVLVLGLIGIGTVFAQPINSPQVTINQDIQNNPLAQEILKKIEQSKRWIEQIQQRTAENLEKQKELEAKKAIVLKNLKEDLEDWEELWYSYSFDHMLDKVLEDESMRNSGTLYDHPLKFTASKIQAGRSAMHDVILSGSSPEDARTAYVEAAKITRAEMFAFNILFNVHHNYAYYNQQILFESDGQFIDEISGEKLREYYLDYRTNPAYLQANPLDKTSWNDLGKTNPDTECRTGYVLVHRTAVDDYVCTTKSTSEMWIRHNMGKLVSVNDDKTNTNNVEKLQHDRITQKIDSLNSKVDKMQNFYQEKISYTAKKYDSLFSKLESEKREEEKELTEKFQRTSMSLEKFNLFLEKIALKYSSLRENLEDEESRVIELMNKQKDESFVDFTKNYESDSDMNVVWNSSVPIFEMS